MVLNKKQKGDDEINHSDDFMENLSDNSSLESSNIEPAHHKNNELTIEKCMNVNKNNNLDGYIKSNVDVQDKNLPSSSTTNKYKNGMGYDKAFKRYARNDLKIQNIDNLRSIRNGNLHIDHDNNTYSDNISSDIVEGGYNLYDFALKANHGYGKKEFSQKNLLNPEISINNDSFLQKDNFSTGRIDRHFAVKQRVEPESSDQMKDESDKNDINKNTFIGTGMGSSLLNLSKDFRHINTSNNNYGPNFTEVNRINTIYGIPNNKNKTVIDYLFEIVNTEIKIFDRIANKRQILDLGEKKIDLMSKSRYESSNADLNSEFFEMNELITSNKNKKRGDKPVLNSAKVSMRDSTKYIDENGEEKTISATIINGKKIYFCPFPECTQNFPSKSRFKRHYITHTPKKPYNCLNTSCKKKFSRKDNMLQHYKKHCRKK